MQNPKQGKVNIENQLDETIAKLEDQIKNFKNNSAVPQLHHYYYLGIALKDEVVRGKLLDHLRNDEVVIDTNRAPDYYNFEIYPIVFKFSCGVGQVCVLPIQMYVPIDVIKKEVIREGIIDPYYGISASGGLTG